MTTAARLGRNLLLRDGSGGGATVIAAMRETGFSINGATVDVTDKDSSGQYRELLAGAGIVHVTVTARGILSGATQSQNLVSRSIARSLNTYRIEFDNGDSLEGSFQITRFEASGRHDGEQIYTLTLESGGALTLATV